MKKTPRKKNLIWSGVAILIMAILVGTVTFSLTRQVEAQPQNPIDGTNIKRSQQLVTGTGYTINKEQEKVHKKQEKIHEKQRKEERKKQGLDKAEKRSAVGGKKPVPGDADEKSDGKGDQGQAQKPNTPKPSDPPEKKPEDPNKPTIKTNLASLSKEKQSSSVGFWVKARDYKDRYIDSESLKVTVNGNTLYSKGDNGTKVTYHAELKEGKNNTIAITATDRYGNFKKVQYTIESDSNQKEKIEGKIHFTMTAADIGKPVLISRTQVEVPEGKTLEHTVTKVLEENGFQYVRGSGSGFYLARVKKAGITAGYKIPDGVQKRLDEAGLTVQGVKPNSLGERDFTTNSGWVFSVNGTRWNEGMSAYTPKDGDEIELKFSLEI